MESNPDSVQPVDRETKIEDLVHCLGSMATYEAMRDFERRSFSYRKACELFTELFEPKN
jgi:hypothetical protein